jgi:hypothetical protein
MLARSAGGDSAQANLLASLAFRAALTVRKPCSRTILLTRPCANCSRLCIIAAALVAICSTPLRAADGVSNDKIIFGQVATLNGPAQALGQGMREGILAAFEDANRAGGVNGRKLELKSIDDSYEPEKTIIATNNAIMEERAFALVGAVGTPTSKAGQPIATAAKVPFIGPFTGAEFDMALVALECALVAAGLLEAARFSSLNIWDVAAGIALVGAGGGVVREHDGMHWAPMQRSRPFRAQTGLARLATADRRRDQERGRDHVRRDDNARTLTNRYTRSGKR